MTGYQWAGDAAGYTALHVRVRRARGNACEHDCIECGKQARDWARIHDKSGLDVLDYQPMCRKCHHAYDDVHAAGEAAHRAKLTWQIARRIKALSFWEGSTASSLAMMTGVHRVTVWDILHGKGWRDEDDPENIS